MNSRFLIFDLPEAFVIRGKVGATRRRTVPAQNWPVGTRVPGRSTGLVRKVVSGGQTGAAEAGWRAALACGISTTGWMPPGFLTEHGPRPDFAPTYNAREACNHSEERLVEANVCDSDGTLWFGTDRGDGASDIILSCVTNGRPYLVIDPDDPDAMGDVLDWLHEREVKSLNVAGDTESITPGIGRRVEEFLIKVFECLGEI